MKLINTIDEIEVGKVYYCNSRPNVYFIMMCLHIRTNNTICGPMCHSMGHPYNVYYVKITGFLGDGRNVRNVREATREEDENDLDFSHSSALDDNVLIERRIATYEERRWLEACVLAGELVEKPLNTEQYEIY